MDTLNIFLIKLDFDYDSIIPSVDKLKHLNFSLEGGENADFYTKTDDPTKPAWSDFFNGFDAKELIGETSSPSALLLLTVDNRVYAITFGFGRYFLSHESYEKMFGMKVVLNSVEKVVSIDKKAFDAISSRSRIQSVRETSVLQFGIDIDRDILKGIKGKPIDRTLGSTMNGSDALTVNVNTNLNSLPKLLPEYCEKFLDDSYKKSEFAFVDDIKFVSNKSTITELDEKFIQRLLDEDIKDIEMSIPDIVDYEIYSEFSYSTKSTVNSLQVLSFLDSMKIPTYGLSTKRLKDKKIFAVDSSGERQVYWSAYKCFYVETELKDKQYILTDGIWYEANKDFISKLDTYVSQIPISNREFPDYDDNNELEYNTRAGKALGMVLFDQELIYIDYGKIEFCDLYSNNKEMIHVKRGSNSSSLSHLFAQGLVSCETFLQDQPFREKVNEKLPNNLKLKNVNRKPVSSDYTVVFGIVSKKEQAIDLPFFSKVNLRRACRQIDNFNYNTQLALIQEDENWAKKQKIKAKKRKEAREKAK